MCSGWCDIWVSASVIEIKLQIYLDKEKSVTKPSEASYSQMSQILLIQNVLFCDKERGS